MIQIQDVSFEYEKEQGTLSHIDLNIQQGECVVLTGESGCGKTTVTKLINGLIPHFVEGGTLSGRAIVNDMEVPKTEMYRLAEQVGSVFQNPKSQFFNIDSDSEITFGLENAGVEPKKIKERYEATVSALKIQSLLGRNIFSMSGGEKQSLAFASVYAMNPSIFVLDEPTASCIYTQKGNKKIRKPQAVNQTALIFARRVAARLLSINSIRRLCWS